ncbi:MAG: type II toxin-antitoxin system Phd/YefM family antitoxin, partial [Fibrobacterota bacterium]
MNVGEKQSFVFLDKLVVKPVYTRYIDCMDDITVKEIGSFEAKTHLSSLLREVEEKGTEFHITRRGKAV